MNKREPFINSTQFLNVLIHQSTALNLYLMYLNSKTDMKSYSLLDLYHTPSSVSLS